MFSFLWLFSIKIIVKSDFDLIFILAKKPRNGWLFCLVWSVINCWSNTVLVAIYFLWLYRKNARWANSLTGLSNKISFLFHSFFYSVLKFTCFYSFSSCDEFLLSLLFSKNDFFTNCRLKPLLDTDTHTHTCMYMIYILLLL